MIEIVDLKKVYGDNVVLNGISETIHDGEKVVVIGPSGSGKSTFLRCLNCMEDPDGGKIIFEGVDIADMSVDINLHREKIGMVFQQFNLFNNKTVLENITLAPVYIGCKKANIAKRKNFARNIANLFRKEKKDLLYVADKKQIKQDAIGYSDKVNPDFMKGDVIRDKRITASDARAALRFAAKIDVPSAEQFRAADVNEDGKLNAMDARLILRVAAKLDVFEEESEPESKSETEIIPSEPANDNVNEATTQEQQDSVTETTTQETTLPINVEIIVTTEESPEKSTTAPVTTTEKPSETVSQTQATQPETTTRKPVITTTPYPVTTTKVQPNDDDAVVITKSTNEYHDLECAVLLYGDDEIFALSLAQAKKNGYTPCRNCIG